MIKSFIFKTAVVLLLAVFAFGFVSVKENKSACAAVCPYCLGCEADWYSVAVEFVQMGADMIVSWFQNAVRMAKQFFLDKIKSMFSVEKMMKTISQQERLADMTVIGQKGQIREALAMLRKTTAYQRSQVDTVARRFPAPTDETCKDTTIRTRTNVTERYADFETAVQRERDRVRNGMTVRTGAGGSYGVGAASSSLLGPVVRKTALRNSAMGLCFTDENLGKHSEMCSYTSSSATGGAYVNYLKNPSLLITPMTTQPWNIGLQVLPELLLPPVASQRFPGEALKEDATTQEVYMKSVERAAIQNLYEEIIRQFIANTSEFDAYDFSGPNFTNCEENRKFVKEVASRKYGLRDARPGGQYGCPSNAEMKWAEVMSTVNTGYIATAGTSPNGTMYQAQLNAVVLDHKLAFEEIDKHRTLLLQKTLENTLRTGGTGTTPSDATGRR